MISKIIKKIRPYFIINFLVLLFLYLLPYYLFNGKLFVGGDDSRLFYVYPWEWFTNIAYYSWFHLSSVGSDNPNQFLLPFLLVWTVISWVIKSHIILDYLSFTLPLFLGFIYFQKLMGEIVENKKDNGLYFIVGSLTYIFSPIIANDQLAIFLYAAWLIGLLPIITYYFIKYLKTGNFLYIFINLLWCILLSFSLSSIPWLLGYLLPVLLSLLVVSPLFSKKEIIVFLIRSFVFFGSLIISQAFWIYPFVINVLSPEKNSFLGIVLSQQSSNTFNGTVLSTATGSVIYPLLNLFHRQMSIDYNSPLKIIFLQFYDKTVIFDVIYVVIFFLGVLTFKKYLTNSERTYYLIFLVSFIFALFFFTINIGPLAYIFLYMGHIPGFVMFRNFFDKFALSYTFLYAIILTLSLIIVSRKLKRTKNIILIIVLLVVLINLIPIKAIINKLLWTTNNTYSVTTIPLEYLDFMNQVKNTIPTTTNILSVPFNIAGYTIIKDTNSNNVYEGRSPVQLFTGINDLSGNLSFPSSITARLVSDLIRRNYKDLNLFLEEYNISYVFVTNNIPREVKNSYLFDKIVLTYQDKIFLKAITNKKILHSSHNDYEIYTTKFPTSLFKSKNLSYKKINPVTYQLTFSHIRNPQQLVFFDSYSSGWKLYPDIYSSPSNNIMSYLIKKNIFADSQDIFNNYANKWKIDPNFIKQKFSQRYYHTNTDGTIDMTMTLYFEPQENFYIGTLISVLTIIIFIIYFICNRFKKDS